MHSLTAEAVQKLQMQAAELFSPRTPIRNQDLFSGRSLQIQKLNATIAQAGAHAIVYGERGVGKTSLANIAPIAFHVYHDVPAENIVSTRINCDGTDSYDSLWRKVFKSIHVTAETMPVGLLAKVEEELYPLLDSLNVLEFTPGEVQRVLSQIAPRGHLVITLDEFDRLPTGPVPALIADTIKTLSDNETKTTLIIVGVGESVASLVQGHESVGRHLVEVPLQRMSREELENILCDRLPKLNGMSIEVDAKRFVSLVSAGLPYFTHLLGQHAAKAALGNRSNVVTKDHVATAMKNAIADSEREMKEAYYNATQSRHPASTFNLTLAACALAVHDDFGYFAAANIRDVLSRIKGGDITMGAFTPHLDRYCDPNFGSVLQQTGMKHYRRYRFRNPLMQPFVIIRSLEDGLINVDQIKNFVSLGGE
jgi:Cdc6-like AAA superfamily ATPase